MKKFKNELRVLCACMLIGLAMTLASYGGTKAVNNEAEYWHQMYLNEKKECILWRNIAHQYWQYLDYDDRENHLGHGNFFDDCISETDTYDQLNELLEGDFEDFFCEWESHYEEINW